MFVPMLVAPANGGFYTSNSATIFSLVASKDGNNVYHSVNNGYASFNKPTPALTTYKPAAAPPPLSSTPTSDHRKKELNGIFARHQTSPSTADPNQLESNVPEAPIPLRRGAPTTTSSASDSQITPKIFFADPYKVPSDAISSAPTSMPSTMSPTSPILFARRRYLHQHHHYLRRNL